MYPLIFFGKAKVSEFVKFKNFDFLFFLYFPLFLRVYPKQAGSEQFPFENKIIAGQYYTKSGAMLYKKRSRPEIFYTGAASFYMRLKRMRSFQATLLPESLKIF